METSPQCDLGGEGHNKSVWKPPLELCMGLVCCGGWSGGTLQEDFCVEWPTFPGLPRAKLDFLDFKSESSRSWKPSLVSGKPGQLVISETGGERWDGWLGMCVQWRHTENFLSQGIDPYLLMNLLRKTQSLLLCQYLPSAGEVPIPMHQDEIACVHEITLVQMLMWEFIAWGIF